MSHDTPQGIAPEIRPCPSVPESIRAKLEAAWLHAEAAGHTLDGLLRRPYPLDRALLDVVIGAFARASELAAEAAADLEGCRHVD